MKTTINYIISTMLTTIVYYLGGLDTAMKTLLILMVLDYATGICKSIVNKKNFYFKKSIFHDYFYVKIEFPTVFALLRPFSSLFTSIL